jgi:hypothetical protein
MAGATFREGATPVVLLPRIRRMPTSENSVMAKFVEFHFHALR